MSSHPSRHSSGCQKQSERKRERERAVARRFAFEACPPAETRLEFADRVPGIEAPSEERREVSLYY